jgi:hypothetical protein
LVKKTMASSERELVRDDGGEEKPIESGKAQGDTIGFCRCGGRMNSAGYRHEIGTPCTRLALKWLGTYTAGGTNPTLI